MSHVLFLGRHAIPPLLEIPKLDIFRSIHTLVHLFCSSTTGFFIRTLPSSLAFRLHHFNAEKDELSCDDTDARRYRKEEKTSKHHEQQLEKRYDEVQKCREDEQEEVECAFEAVPYIAEDVRENV